MLWSGYEQQQGLNRTHDDQSHTRRSAGYIRNITPFRCSASLSHGLRVGRMEQSEAGWHPSLFLSVAIPWSWPGGLVSRRRGYGGKRRPWGYEKWLRKFAGSNRRAKPKRVRLDMGLGCIKPVRLCRFAHDCSSLFSCWCRYCCRRSSFDYR